MYNTEVPNEKILLYQSSKALNAPRNRMLQIKATTIKLHHERPNTRELSILGDKDLIFNLRTY